MPDLKRLSKTVSTILRHRAGDFGLQLDAQGFADYPTLRAVVEKRFSEAYSEQDWQAIIAGGTDGKKRFELVDGRIRALYGHSRVSPVSYDPVAPPEFLYHGTTPQALRAIRREGLRPMKRQYVHLSVSTDRAASVAERRAQNAIILPVRAGQAHRAGVEFFHPEAQHYLAKSIPAQFIDFPEA